MGPDELNVIEELMHKHWERASLRELRGAIENWRRQLGNVTEDQQDSGVGPAPAETVALWVKRVASMEPDELDDFERRTFAAWDRASLGDLRRAIEGRQREIAQ